MSSLLLPPLLLLGAGLLFSIGFRKLPVLLGLGALMTGLAAIGVKKPEEVGLVIVLVGVAVFWVGMIGYIIYLKWSTWTMRRDAEARKRASTS